MLLSILRRLSSLLFCLLFANSVQAALTDIKFGQYQIAGTQWNVSACTTTSTCEIYSKNPGDVYKIPWTNGKLYWGYQDYVKFELSGNSSYPYTATQYYGNGTVKAVMGNGKIVNMGPDYFFFVGDDNNTGQLFSGSSGMSDTSGITWTGTRNPTIAQADAYADANYSTVPLAAGETATTTPNTPPPPPPPPTPVYGSSGPTNAQQTRIATIQNNPTGHEVEVNIIGNSNIVHIDQAGTPSYVNLMILGNTNSFNATQSMSPGAHAYNETIIIGNTNDVDLLQTGSGNKTAFINVNGGNNTANVIQKDGGDHFLQLDITGDNHSAAILQEGTGNHAATVVLDGNQPWNFNLTQSGATAQTYTLPHAMSDGSNVSGTCNAVGGCNLTVNQQ